jgi:hypothetical protein
LLRGEPFRSAATNGAHSLYPATPGIERHSVILRLLRTYLEQI